MPGTIIEQHGSRSFNIGINKGSAAFKYFVFGESDEAAVEALVYANAPATWYAYTRDDIQCDRRNALDQWDVTVSYVLLAHELETGDVPDADPDADPPPASPSSSPPGGTELLDGVTFSISLENEHLDVSEEVLASQIIAHTGLGWLVTENHAKYGGLVNVAQSDDGSRSHVGGYERGSPVANIRRKVTTQGMTYQYFTALMKLVGCTNSTAWWIFGEQDSLFVGVDGQQLDVEGRFDLNFEWLYRQPYVDKVWATVELPDSSTLDLVATKRGMQYISFGYSQLMIDDVPV